MKSDTRPIEEIIQGTYLEYKLGGINLFLTPQEHALLGSSYGGHYTPYIPLAVQLGNCSVEMCEVIRKRKVVFGANLIYYGKRGEVLGHALLPGLDLNPNSPTYGQTLEDPELLNPDFYPAHDTNVRDIPFARLKSP